MKKVLLVVFCAVAVFLLTGCGKNQVKCTGSFSEEGLTIKAEVVGDLDKDDKLVDATIVYDLGDENTATQYCSLFKLMEDAAKGVTVTCSGAKITIAGYANVASDDDSESMVGATKEDFIKAMEEESFTCK